MRLHRVEHGAHLAIDEAQRGLVLDRVVGEGGALAVHVHRVAVQVALARRGIAQTGSRPRRRRCRAGPAGWRAAACRRSGVPVASRSADGEVHVAGHVARRVGIGDVAGQQALPLGAQHQRLALEVEAVAEAVDHRGSDGRGVHAVALWAAPLPNMSANSARKAGHFAAPSGGAAA